MGTEKIEQIIIDMSQKAKAASSTMLELSSQEKNSALLRVAQLLRENKSYIQEENLKDLEAGRKKDLSEAMLNRLELSDAVIESMITGLKEVVALPDPIGSVDELKKRPNGLQVGRMRVPLGVIGMIYESRPNVTVDAAALCLKTGNAVILRGGSEAIHSNLALSKILKDALASEGINQDAIQVIPVVEREAVNVLLQQEEYLDLIIPRGGEGLIRFVAENSRVPVLKHYKGVCHVFVDKDADLEKALPIIVNGKTHRPGVCNALEGVLVHQDVASDFLPLMSAELTKKGVQMLGCAQSDSLVEEIQPAQEDDWGTEFLDLKMCVKVVKNFSEMQQYIQKYGSQHTEVIVTENYTTANRFIQTIDASAVMVNASTRFNDGGQLGLGTEIGISTTKLHAYGPMGLEELTTRKFVVFGDGQVRY